MNKLVISLILFAVSFPLYANSQVKSKCSNNSIDEGNLVVDDEELLEMDTEELMDVVIYTASKMVECVSKSVATTTVIDQKQIKEMGARNLLDVLKVVPGFGITQSQFGVRQIEVRGVNTLVSEKVLIMLNGHPLDHNLLNAGGTWAYDDLPVGSIKRLEIVRGTGSALYGANAFLAVINIMTQNAEDLDGFHVSAGGGSFDTQQYLASWGKKFDNGFEAALHFNFSDTGGIGSPLFTNQTQAMIGESKLSETRYDFEWQLGFKDFKFEGRYINKEQGTFFGPINELSDNRSKQNYENYFFKLSRDWKINDQLTINTEAFYDVFTANNLWVVAPNTPFALWHTVNKNQRTGAEVQANYTIDERQKIIIGFSYAEEIQNGIIDEGGPDTNHFVDIPNTTSNKKRRRWGVYAQDIWDPHKDLRLTFSARYDQYSDFGGTFNPRIGLNWEIIKNYSLRLSYGTAYRPPSFGELTYTNPITKGNLNLKPEEVETFEAGIIAHPIAGLTIQSTYYHTTINEIISLIPSSSFNSDYQNTGSIKSQGVETEIRYNFSGELKGSYLSANGVWQNSKQSGRLLADAPRYRMNFMANWAIDDTWSSFAHVLIKGSTLRNVGDTRANVSGYTVVDLGVLGKNLFNQKIDIGFNVHNLFDKHYYDPAPQNLDFSGDFQAAGITFFGHVDIRF